MKEIIGCNLLIYNQKLASDAGYGLITFTPREVAQQH